MGLAPLKEVLLVLSEAARAKEVGVGVLSGDVADKLLRVGAEELIHLTSSAVIPAYQNMELGMDLLGHEPRMDLSMHLDLLEINESEDLDLESLRSDRHI